MGKFFRPGEFEARARDFLFEGFVKSEPTFDGIRFVGQGLILPQKGRSANAHGSIFDRNHVIIFHGRTSITSDLGTRFDENQDELQINFNNRLDPVLSQASQVTKLEINLKSHIPALDGLRGVAVAAVFLLHYHPDEQLGPWVLRLVDRAAFLGWAGVSLFFSLSGFLITGILWDSLGRPHWWRNFYVRRSLRIFPLYYLVLIAATVVALAMGATWNATSKISIDFLYLTDIPSLWGQMWGFPLQSSLVHFWSLAVEEQFYLIWPFLILAFAKNRQGLMKLCVVVWLASLAFRLVAVGLDWSWLWPHHFLLARAGELCAGGFLALALRGAPATIPSILRIARWMLFFSSAALVVMFVLSSRLSLMDTPWSTLGIAAFSIFFTALIAMCLQPGLIRSLFENAGLRWLGKISYGVYVYHLLLFMVFERTTHWLAPNAGPLKASILLFVVGLCGTLLTASLSFYTFERAFLSLKERFAGHGGTAAKSPVTTAPALTESR
jgi:peptidoglycan/LPS O-acetylase OafA/YrhL